MTSLRLCDGSVLRASFLLLDSIPPQLCVECTISAVSDYELENIAAGHSVTLEARRRLAVLERPDKVTGTKNIMKRDTSAETP